MSHCNITLPDIYSTEASLREQLAIENSKRVLAEMYRDMDLKNLESVLVRVRHGEETYLCYPNGDVVYIVRVEKPVR